MKITHQIFPRFQACSRGGLRGVTLVEVVLSMAIIGLVMAGVIAGYTMASRRAQWSAYSLAAQALATKRMEQVLAAVWLPGSGVDNIIDSNYPAAPDFLALPTQQTNVSFNATNFTTIRTISTSPNLKMIRVDCVWTMDQATWFTNTIATIHAPNL